MKIPKRLNPHVLISLLYIQECAKVDREECMNHNDFLWFFLHIMELYPKEYAYFSKIIERKKK